MTPAELFYRKVVAGSNNCHIWIGARNVWGYGRLKREGRMYSAHRVAYEMAHGPIPAGLHCLHRCNNRACTNPEHLFLGNNVSNMVGRGAGRWRGYPHYKKSPEKRAKNAENNRRYRERLRIGAAQ
jgi:hypothetical protein